MIFFIFGISIVVEMFIICICGKQMIISATRRGNSKRLVVVRGIGLSVNIMWIVLCLLRLFFGGKLLISAAHITRLRVLSIEPYLQKNCNI